MNNLCFECDGPAEYNHHVIPQILGGTKTVPLCGTCHSLVHDSKFVSCRNLSKEGKKKAHSLEVIAQVLELFEAKTPKLVDGLYGGWTKNRSHYRTLTPEIQTKAQQMRSEGKSWKQIGKELGIDRVTFYKHGLNKGMEDKVRQRMTDEIKNEVLKLRDQNKTWKKIANELNISLPSIYRHGLNKGR